MKPPALLVKRRVSHSELLAWTDRSRCESTEASQDALYPGGAAF